MSERTPIISYHDSSAFPSSLFHNSRITRTLEELPLSAITATASTTMPSIITIWNIIAGLRKYTQEEKE